MKKTIRYQKTLSRKYGFRKLMCIAFIMTLATGCESFLEVELPSSLVSNTAAFSDDVTATSAVTGLYVNLLDPSAFASGWSNSITALGGLSADEFTNFPGNFDELGFEQNLLVPESQYILNLWTSMYKVIYCSNSILEGLESSSGLTSSVRSQLKGEALFVRAFTNFYLTNLYGSVPLITSTDYRVNAAATRTSEDAVYAQIVEDLIEAQSLLDSEYPSPERVRPNKSTATALLARVYLYMNDWANAEIQASAVVNESSKYNLSTDLNEVFLATSGEAIWQLSLPASSSSYLTTYEGQSFIVEYDWDRYNVLSNQLVSAFEVGDQRLANWVGTYDDGVATISFPYKYKVKYGSEPLAEYSVVFRLAEQYLIRAEARAQQDNLSNAISDIDAVRDRAGLPLIQDIDPSITKANLLLAIEHERQIELFSEWGHRWFDLKRTNRIDAILDPLKPEWNIEDALYPIPQSEINLNPKLSPQNPGY